MFTIYCPKMFKVIFKVSSCVFILWPSLDLHASIMFLLSSSMFFISVWQTTSYCVNSVLTDMTWLQRMLHNHVQRFLHLWVIWDMLFCVPVSMYFISGLKRESLIEIILKTSVNFGNISSGNKSTVTFQLDLQEKNTMFSEVQFLN